MSTTEKEALADEIIAWLLDPDARLAGMTQGAIAKLEGLSKTEVQRIINRCTAMTADALLSLQSE